MTDHETQRTRLIVRADANNTVGFGHMIRSLTVATYCLSHDIFEPYLVTARKSSTRVAERAGIKYHRLTHDDLGTDDLITSFSPSEGPILIDSYLTKTDDLKAFRKAGFAVAVFDDGQRLEYYPNDLVIDTAPEASDLGYTGARHTRFLLGTQFFPLRADFEAIRSVTSIRRSLLVTFGGSDLDDQTARICQLLSGSGLKASITVILGPGYTGVAESVVENDAKFTFYRDIEVIGSIMSTARMAISGAGSTALELSYMGVPSILLPQSPDQAPIANALARVGSAVSYDCRITASQSEILAAVLNLWRDDNRLRTMAAVGTSIIDGKGATRIAAHIDAMWRNRFRKTTP